jgi:hypothetical protein
MRNAFMELGREPVSPCTHSGECPFIGGPNKVTKGRNWIDTKKRWCHFAFETTEAPRELHRLSAAAKLPKERLVFSYLLTQKNKVRKDMDTRIISDSFALPENRYGRYGCSAKGLILVTGDKERIDNLTSLNIIPQRNLQEFNAEAQRDAKSGALIMGVE